MTASLPFLDISTPGFSTRGPEVLAARAQHWCARTPFGFAILRHREAGLLLRDRRLRQGSYAWPTTLGLAGSFASFWQRSIISQEGARHKDQRRIAMAALAPGWIETLIPNFTRIAEDLASAIGENCEFIADFSEPFAGRAITTLLGLPDADADALAHDASRLGLAMGIDGKTHEPVFNAATDRLTELAQTLIDRARRNPNGTDFVTRLVGAATQQTDETLRDLIVISIFGGVDTTRAQLGFAMALFADHPDQWTTLRRDPALIPRAIEEVIRARPTTTWATREAIEDFTFQDTTIQSGDTVHILVHATGTDAQANPDWTFDITARRKMHFGFGGGAHHCLGQLVARTDMAAALRVLAQHFTSIQYAGQPHWLPDSGNTSPAQLPLHFTR